MSEEQLSTKLSYDASSAEVLGDLHMQNLQILHDSAEPHITFCSIQHEHSGSHPITKDIGDNEQCYCTVVRTALKGQRGTYFWLQWDIKP